MTAPSTLAAVELQLRRLLLALLVFGLLVVLAELLAVGHYEDSWEFVPLFMIAWALANIAWYLAGGGASSIRLLRVTMVLFIIVGGLGVVLHYRGNVDLQTELNPDISGWALFLKVIHARTPSALAPGAMAQLGLLGLIYAFRHPSLNGTGRPGVR